MTPDTTTKHANGNRDAILEAEQEALAQQDEIPPPYVPPASPTEREKPRELPLFSVEWFDANIAGHEALLRQKYAALCATREYADWQAEHGAVENLKAQRALLLHPPSSLPEPPAP